MNNKIEKLRKDLHQTMQKLDLERDKNLQFTQLIEQKDSDFKRELSELLEDNKQLRQLIKQQQAKLISQDNHHFVNTEIEQSTKINLRSNCNVKKSHVCVINVNDTDTKRNSIIFN